MTTDTPPGPVHLAEEVFRLAGEFNAAVRNAYEAGVRVTLEVKPHTVTPCSPTTLVVEPAPSLSVNVTLSLQTDPILPALVSPPCARIPEESWAIGSNETSVRWPVIVDKTTGVEICDIAQSYDIGAPEHDPERREAMRLANLIVAAPKMLKALLLSQQHEALPADRGGAHGPKGMARARFVTARRYAIDLAFGKVKP